MNGCIPLPSNLKEQNKKVQILEFAGNDKQYVIIQHITK
jgi:hypothetical protein